MVTYSIEGFRSPLILNNSWTTNDPKHLAVNLDHRGATIIEKAGNEPAYFVLNATDKEFRQLSGGRTIDVSEFSSLEVSTDIDLVRLGKSSLMFLEYDSKGKRVGQVELALNTRAIVTFGDVVSQVVMALRLAGSGDLTVNRIDLSRASGPERDEQTKFEYISRGHTPGLKDLPELARDAQDLSSLAQSVSRRLRNVEQGAKSSKAGESADSRAAGSIATSRENLAQELLRAMAQSLPDSNGSRHFSKVPLRVGVISDDSMFNFYKDAFESVSYLSPSNYSETMAGSELDAILYVTCWRGLANDEWKGLHYRPNVQEALEGILSAAADANIPTIFQSIEDPSNFDHFLPIAKKFDYIFTSDSLCIEKYKEVLGHNRIFYGEYGVNPLVNSPVGSWRFDIPRYLFSGSYPERYKERVDDMVTIFDSVQEINRDLTIIDRNFESDGFRFPEKYQPAIIGRVPHDLLQKIHKLFRYSLNFNSIKQSPTMCAMRVYELQGQGKALISNYANSVFNNFPEIRIVPFPTALELESGWRRLESQVLSQRALTRVMSENVSFKQVAKMMSLTGHEIRNARPERVLVVVDGNDEQKIEHIKQFQQLVEFDIVPESNFSDSDLLGYGYVARMSLEKQYGRFYLAERKAAFHYVDVDVVSSVATIDEFSEVIGQVHEYVDSPTSPDHSMAATDSPAGVGFVIGSSELGDFTTYAVTPFEAPRDAMQITVGGEPALSVIIPVFGNGRFLESKCMPSLIRNERFEQFQIILVDDGSNDDYTLAVCEELCRKYPNVQFESFGDGGSGSASRPRNRGIELAQAELITFLDPDNEISARGYDKLLKSYEDYSFNQRIDFVSGFQVKVGDGVRTTGRHTSEKPRLVDNTREEFFNKGNFPVVSTQASVIRKEFLVQNEINFVVNSVGQDTLFGWEVLGKSSRCVFVDDAYLIYYAERTGSVTNTVDSNFFKKSLVLEKNQAQKLRDMELLDLYLEHHFENFIKGWYLDKLDRVDSSQKEEANIFVENICALYGRSLNDFR